MILDSIQPLDPTFPAALVAAICMVLFTAIASIDGLYFHLYRYRLYARPASRYEHWLHTINAFLFVPLTALLYCTEPLGLCRHLVLALFITSVVIEILDVRCEGKSRADLGGLTTSEYLMHFLMSGLRFGSVMPLLASGPLVLWLPQHTSLGPRPLWLFLTGAWLAGPGVLIAILHVYLARRPLLPVTSGLPLPTAAHRS